MARVRSALLAGFIAASAWMFFALLFGAFTNGSNQVDSAGRAGIAWIGVAFLVVTFLVTLLISNSIHHSAVQRRDRKALNALERERAKLHPEAAEQRLDDDQH